MEVPNTDLQLHQTYSKNIDRLYWETRRTDGSNKEASSAHYAWIMNHSAFIADIIAAKGKHLLWGKKWLGQMQRQNIFEMHEKSCHGVESCGQVFMMPEPGKWSQLSFRNFSNGTQATFMI